MELVQIKTITRVHFGPHHLNVAEGKFKFVIAEGESMSGMIPATGNTNTRGRFKPDARTFLKNWCAEGPTHHFALGVGHYAQTIRIISDLLGIECVVV